MQENPYSMLSRVFREYAGQGRGELWCFGEVVASSPLCVSLRGIPLSGADLMVNPQLLEHTVDAKLTGLSGSLSGTPDVSVSSGALSGKVSLGTVLTQGDLVVLLPMQDGNYFVLCKAAPAS